MARTRDDFSARTKLDLALRASYLCSSCKRSTAGPSDEAPDAVTMIGIAAHICAAAPGPGARRYDPTMTPRERCTSITAYGYAPRAASWSAATRSASHGCPQEDEARP